VLVLITREHPARSCVVVLSLRDWPMLRAGRPVGLPGPACDRVRATSRHGDRQLRPHPDDRSQGIAIAARLLGCPEPCREDAPARRARRPTAAVSCAGACCGHGPPRPGATQGSRRDESGPLAADRGAHVATGRSRSVPMRVSTLPARRRWPLDEKGSRLRIAATGCVANASNEEGAGTGRCGARAQETASLSR